MRKSLVIGIISDIISKITSYMRKSLVIRHLHTNMKVIPHLKGKVALLSDNCCKIPIHVKKSVRSTI